MELTSLLNDLHAQQLRVWVSEQNTLALGYEGNVAPTLLTALKAHKAELLALLSAHQICSEAAFLSWPLLKPVPLSNAQARLLYVDKRAPKSCAYHIPMLVELNDPAQQQDIISALAQLLVHHPILTSVIETDAEHFNCRATLQPLAVEYHRATTLAHVQTLVREHIHTPFDLHTQAPFRVCIIELEQRRFMLFLWHHIVFDAWSMRVMLRDLVSLLRGESIKPLSYFDFAKWQQRQEQSAAHSYWQTQLAGAHATQIAPLFATQAQETESLTHYFALSPQQSQALRALAKSLNTTVYSVLLAHYCYILALHSGETDIVIGAPSDNRDHPQTQEMIGFFVNTLVLRVKLDYRQSFASLVQQVHETVRAAKQYQSYPYDQQVACLSEGKHSPQPSLMFSVQRFASELMDEFALPFSAVDVFTNESLYNPIKCDFRLAFDDSNTNLQGQISLDPNKFDDAFAQQFAHTYQQILVQQVEHSDVALKQLSTSHPSTKPPATTVKQTSTLSLYQQFLACASATPDAPALQINDEVITYQTLAARVQHLVLQLQAQLIHEQNPVVALMFERSPEMIVAILATLGAGAGYLPLNPEQGQARSEFMLQDSGANLLLCHQATLNTAMCFSAITEVQNIDELAQQPAPVFNSDQAHSPCHSSLAYIIYTSGSTGKPKGVMVEQRQVQALVQSATAAYNFNSSEKTLSLAPYFFDASVEPLFLTLLNGACWVIMNEASAKSPAVIRDALVSQKISHLVSVPAFLSAIGTPPDHHALRRVITGGEPCDRNLMEAWTPLLHIEYGPTETTVTATANHQPLHSRYFNNIGAPLAHVDIQIVDANLKALPPFCQGEILIGGASVARGYVNLAEQTASRFINWHGTRMYRTGDQARYLANGEIQFLGRADEQVKIRGYRIELQEIEHLLNLHPQINQACVKVQQNNHLIAYFTGDQTLSHTEIVKWLQPQLPDYMLPSATCWLEQLPVLASGKVDSRSLPSVALVSQTPYRAPRTPLEQQLCDLWQTQLEVELVGIDDDFFALGGHSLSAMTLVAKMHSSCNVDISLSQFLQSKTIAQLVSQQASNTNEPLPVASTSQSLDEIIVPAQQQAMLTSEQLATQSGAFHIPLQLKCQSGLQQQALQHAIYQLVERHAILRTRYTQQQQGRWAYKDEQGMPTCETLINTPHSEFIAQTFDLENDAPLRLGLYHQDDEFGVLLVFHHIAFDGWSTQVLLDELNTLLSGHTLAPTSLQFRDYAYWQSTQQYDEAAAFWQQHLIDIDVTPWPTDKPRQALFDHQGEAFPLTLSATLTAELRELAKSHQVSMYNLLLCAFQLALCAWDSRESIVVGSPTDNRDSAFKDTLGYFVNTLPMPLHVDLNKSFSDYLRQSQTLLLAAKSHQQLPLESIAAQLGLIREVGVSPLFQVFFTFDQFSLPTAQYQHFEVASDTAQQNQYHPAKFDWNLVIKDMPDQLIGQLIVARSRYQSSRCQQFVHFFCRYLENLCQYNEKPLLQCPLVSTEYLQQVISETRLSQPNDAFLVQFAKTVAAYPERTALSFAEQTVSYRELDLFSDHLAAQLIATNDEGSPVALYFDKGIEAPIAMLAALKAGMPFVSLSANQPVARRQEIMAKAQAKLLLSRTPLSWNALPTLTLDVQTLQQSAQLRPFSANNHATDKLAYLIFTSGTTGEPKGAMLSYQGLANLCTEKRNTHKLEGNTQVVTSQYAEYVFDACICEIFPALAAGAKLEIIPEPIRKDPQQLCRYLKAKQVNVAFIPTVFINQFPKWIADINLTVLYSGGSRLDPVSHKLAEHHFNEYGLSETSVTATLSEVYPNTPITIGKPIRNTRCYVLDSFMRILPDGALGELYIAGDCVGLGYWQSPKQTAKHYIDYRLRGDNNHFSDEKLYRSGDLVRKNQQGEFEFVARADKQWDLHGHRVEPGEIEYKLKAHPDVEHAVAHLHLSETGKVLLGYVVLNANTKCDVNDLRQWLNQQLPGYMQLAAISQIDALPMTVNGKLDTTQLIIPMLQDSITYIAPETELQQQLANAWQQVLKISEIGLQHDFFALGGSSIQAAQVTALCSQALGNEIAVATLLTYPQLDAFATQVEQQLNALASSEDCEFEMEL
ncbi:non-ribosomal peptide synthetase [Pseudoalteromonas sp. OF7H-1]|uniref:non-ribosomal peptide synthetase n=1 Tax=Pseudoalteromonas sp. OF7H-1 TaxID=2917755 RepID=UPI001EF4C3B4|nr:non-ribosomal peptide synthetase [Pseudoalteromonas sp. OF7H-1]MCG7541043.1 amino acid adenylation domain-containing protein [Pseudoalteromonas sp. OF7H-1]